MAQEPRKHFSLDRTQVPAAESAARAVAIVGGPGTGKTRTLVARVRHWLDSGVSPEDILVVTPNRAQMDNFFGLLREAGGMNVGIMPVMPRFLATLVLRNSLRWATNTATDFTVWERARTLRALELYASQFMDRPIHRGELREFLLMPGLYDSSMQWVGAKLDWDALGDAFNQLKAAQGVVQSRSLVKMAIDGLKSTGENDENSAISKWGHLAIDNLEDLTREDLELLLSVVGGQPHLAVAVNVHEQVHGSWLPMSDSRVLFQSLARDEWDICKLGVNHRLSPMIVEMEKQVRQCGGETSFSHDTDSTTIQTGLGTPRLHRVRGTLEEMDRVVLGHMQRLADEGVDWRDMACLSYRPHTRERFSRLLVRERIRHLVLGDDEDAVGDALLDQVMALIELVANPRDSGALLDWLDSMYREKGVNAGLPVTRRICRSLPDSREELAQGIEREAARHRRGSLIRETLEWSAEAYREVSALFGQGSYSVGDLWLKASNLMGPASATALDNYRVLISPFLNEVADEVNLPHSVDEMREGSRWQWGDREDISLATFRDSKGLQWDHVWLLDVGEADIPADTPQGQDFMRSAVTRPLAVALTRCRVGLYLYYACTPADGRAAWPFFQRTAPALDQEPLRYLPRGEFLEEVWLDAQGRAENTPGAN